MLLEHLSSHSLLYGFPNETGFLPYFLQHQVKYGNLTDDRRFLNLWNEMRKLVPGRVAPGAEKIPLPESWRGQPRTVASVFNQIMLRFAAVKGKKIWCEKTPMHVHHLRLLAQEFPESKFIHIVRDGRDCAASFHRRWKFNPVRTIYRWKHAVSAGKRQGSLLGARYHEVRYEEITTAPEKGFREICAFLDIPFEESVLFAAKTRPHMSGSNAQTIERNSGRAAHYFSARKLEKLESVAGRYLTELGYVCRNSSGDREPASWALRWWELTDDLRRLRVVAIAEGRILKRSKWPYIFGRVKRGIKQKLSLKP